VRLQSSETDEMEPLLWRNAVFVSGPKKGNIPDTNVHNPKLSLT
jgi:hypothetical protein